MVCVLLRRLPMSNVQIVVHGVAMHAAEAHSHAPSREHPPFLTKASRSLALLAHGVKLVKGTERDERAGIASTLGKTALTAPHPSHRPVASLFGNSTLHPDVYAGRCYVPVLSDLNPITA